MAADRPRATIFAIVAGDAPDTEASPATATDECRARAASWCNRDPDRRRRTLMRLAIIRQYYTPYRGAERFLESALEALLERNVAISVYTREWPETKLQLIEPVICNPFFIGRLWRDAGFARAVGRAIGAAKANLVQSHELMLCCDVYRPADGVYATRLAEELRGAGWFARLRIHLDPYHRYALETERKLFASPWLRAVICGSNMMRDEIRDRYALPEERLLVLHNAVDTEVFHPRLRAQRMPVRDRWRIASDVPLFLHVSDDFARSGAGEAIAALAELPPPAHLVLVGRERRWRRFRRLARKLGLADRVTFAGSPTDHGAWYGAADAFVLPTVYDPCPTTVFEAMATALPVITSTKSGAADLLLENDGGLACPARDVAGLAAQMRALLDPATRARLGANGRRAMEPLSPAATTLKLVLLYKELLAATVASRNEPAEVAAEDPVPTASPPTAPASTVLDAASASTAPVTVPATTILNVSATPGAAPASVAPSAPATGDGPPGTPGTEDTAPDPPR